VLEDVLAVGIEERHRIGAQLEGMMLECDLRAEPARGFIEDGNLEIAIRSCVIGEHVNRDHASIVTRA
jgi:hypothetical protein